MPTGYTYQLLKDNQTFPQFAMSCARNFGALIDMRDEPMDAAIPEEFKPSGYYVEWLNDSEIELNQLLAMNHEQRLAYAKEMVQSSIKTAHKILSEYTEENAKFQSMIDKVNAWQPPSKDHENMKRFMLEQLKMSLHDLSYWQDQLKEETSDKDLEQLFLDKVAALRKSIVDAKENYEKEVSRVKERNEWLKLMRESLKSA